MSDGRLPRELIDAVTDNLHENHDRDGLLACSLLCRSWLPSSQRHLFRRVTFTLDDDDCERQAQAFLSSPRLVDYIRALKVQLHADQWDANWEASKRACRATDQTLPVVLRKLSKLQSLDLRKLDWDALAVDLRQSLRRVFLLPSITFLTLDIARVGPMVDFVSPLCHPEGLTGFLLTYDITPSWQFQDSLTREDQEENEERPRLGLHERKHLSDLNLTSNLASILNVWVGWFLGPRSPLDVSHIQTLRVDRLYNNDEKAFNCLLSAIGSSLKHLEFFVPDQEVPWPILEPFFDISLEFNPNIRFLRLTNINLVEFNSMSTPESFVLTWLLRLIPKIASADTLEQIQLHVIVDPYEYTMTCSDPGWRQVDCALAGKFRRLQKLDIDLWSSTEEDDSEIAMVDEIGQCMADAHPLLAEQGVSVDIQCKDREFWNEEPILF